MNRNYVILSPEHSDYLAGQTQVVTSGYVAQEDLIRDYPPPLFQVVDESEIGEFIPYRIKSPDEIIAAFCAGQQDRVARCEWSGVRIGH